MCGGPKARQEGFELAGVPQNQGGWLLQSPTPHSPGIRPLWNIPSGCGFFAEPWTVTRSSLCVLRQVAAFCRPLRPVFLVVSLSR